MTNRQPSNGDEPNFVRLAGEGSLFADIDGDSHLKQLLDRSKREIKNTLDTVKDDDDKEEIPSRVRKWLKAQVLHVLVERKVNVEHVSLNLKCAFEDYIRMKYRQPVYSHVMERRRTVNGEVKPIRDADLANKLGIDRATVKKWREGKNEISFDSWCVISAGFDICYKRGHAYALAAYVAALQNAVLELKGDKTRRVFPETVWYLYHHMRSTSWWYGLVAQNERLLQTLANAYRDSFEANFQRDAHFGDLKEQLDLMADFWLEWSFIELELPHGWF